MDFKEKTLIVLDLLKGKYPNTPIVFITSLPRVNQDDPRGENGQKEIPLGTLADYVRALKQVVARENLPFLDLFSDKDFALENPKFSEYISEDGLHPTDAGHELLAKK